MWAEGPLQATGTNTGHGNRLTRSDTDIDNLVERKELRLERLQNRLAPEVKVGAH